MNDSAFEAPLLILLAGVLIILSMLAKGVLERLRIPPLIGYVFIGFLFRWVGSDWSILSEGAGSWIEFLSNLGIMALLFRVGLESDLGGLLGQLRRAQGIWFGNVALSALLGYPIARYLLDFDLIPSLFVTVALTATSVGVPVAVWREADAMGSENGELLLDVAELDDISAIGLMTLLFAVAPLLELGNNGALLTTVLLTGGWLLVKLLVFGSLCFLFSRFVEAPVTRFFEWIEPTPDPMLTVLGMGMCIAALAGLLGFSVALGAFFAGLIFSRDADAVKMDASFDSLYELFTPFFFIGIGLRIEPAAVTSAWWPGIALLGAAVLGKVIGTAVPAWTAVGGAGALLLAVSMVPRAEIAMIVMQEGRKLGDWAVPHEAFAAILIVATATCLLSPLVIRALLYRWPQDSKKR